MIPRSSDGDALVRALLADPNDDAPWLIYADWLDENGADAEGFALRSHLNPIRDALKGGLEIRAVLQSAVQVPPGMPFPEMCAEVPATVVFESRAQEGESTHRGQNSDARGVLFGVIIGVKLLVLALSGIGKQHGSQEKVGYEQERFRNTTAVAPEPIRSGNAGDVSPRLSGVVGGHLTRDKMARWDATELAGYTFVLVNERSVRSFKLNQDGTGVERSSEGAGKVMVTYFTWRLDDLCALVINSPNWTKPLRLLKPKKNGEQHEILLNRDNCIYLRLQNSP